MLRFLSSGDILFLKLIRLNYLPEIKPISQLIQQDTCLIK